MRSFLFPFQIKSNRYIVASNDRGLQDYLRSRPGQPMIYLHLKTPVLEQPSELSRKTVEFKMNDAINFGEKDRSKLNLLKVNEGLPAEEGSASGKRVTKKKKKKQPNPLSCKKKKKKSSQLGGEQQRDNLQSLREKSIDKKKRKRIRLPEHVKKVLTTNKD